MLGSFVARSPTDLSMTFKILCTLQVVHIIYESTRWRQPNKTTVDGECYSSRAGVVCPLHKTQLERVGKAQTSGNSLLCLFIIVCIWTETRAWLCLCVQYFTLWSASKESQIDTNCGYYNNTAELNGLFILCRCVLVCVYMMMERMDA